MIRSILVLTTTGICSIGPVLAHDMQAVITVQIYNAAGLKPSLLSRAEHEADWIFGNAGVGIRWITCRFEQESIGTQVCAEAADPFLFVMWINRDHRSAPVSAEALGFALPITGGANHCAISYRDVQKTFQGNRDVVDLYRLLANVMVHELTHLIFQSNEHSSSIMRANWSRSDFERMSKRQFIFSPEQIKRLHQSLSRRKSGECHECDFNGRF